MNALAVDYVKKPRVKVLDLSIDKSWRTFQKWIQDTNPNHPVLKDSERVIISKLGVNAYPASYVVDCHGKIRLYHQGYWGDNGEASADFKKVIDELLKEHCVRE